MILGTYSRSALFCLVSGISTVVFSAPATLSNTACKVTSDPFEQGVSLNSNLASLNGKCLDSKTFRPAQIVKDTLDNLEFANFMHNHQYWIAKIPKNAEAYEAAFFQIQRFPIVKGIEAAHVQMRIRLRSGNQIELINQNNRKVEKVTSMIISFEAGRPENVPYNFALGAFDHYTLIGRITSSEQRQEERNTTATEQYKLNLNSEQIKEMAVKAVQRSAQAGTETFYNTLRPNCTTEAFDLIDQLPGNQGKFQPFLTLISADPIAQPSLDALKLRGLLQSRVQNMGEELNQNMTRDVALQMPAVKKNEVDYLPVIQDLPWSLVLTSPPKEVLNNSEIKIFEQIKKELLSRIPMMLQATVSAAMISSDQTDKTNSSSKILSAVMAKVNSEMKLVLEKLDSQLSRRPRAIGIYLVPFKPHHPLAQTSLQKFGIQAAIPLNVIEVNVDIDNNKTHEVFFHIAEGTRRVSDEGIRRKIPFYFRGANINVKVEQGHSSSSSQIMLGLNSLEKSFSMQNSQVVFKKAVIPKAENRADRSVMLLSHTQKIQNKAQSIVKVEFGADGGVAGSLSSDLFGNFQILTADSCTRQVKSTPALVGVFGEKPLNKGIIDVLIRGRPVQFQIFAANLDVQTQLIDSMDVRIATGPIQCLSMGSVNGQFKDEGNAMINKMKSEADGSSLVKNLISKILE